MNLLRLAVIIGTLPNNIQNGQTADAVPLMADLNWIVNQINANAAPLSNVALLNAANSFTQVQSGIAATNPANFPIAAQVQNEVFNTLSSTLGTNTLTARIAALPLSAYAVGQVFTFFPAQQNTGAVTLNIDGIGAGAVQNAGRPLVGGELGSTPASVFVSAVAPIFEITNPPPGRRNVLISAKGDILVGTAPFTLARVGAGVDGAVLAYFGSEVTGTKTMPLGSGTFVGPGNSLALNYALSSTQIAGSSTQLPINTAVQNQHPSACKAWGSCIPPTTVQTTYPASGVSVVKNGTGDYTITHGVTFSDRFYPGSFSAINTAGGPLPLTVNPIGQTVTTVRVSITDLAGTPTDPDTTFAWHLFGRIT